MNKPNIYQRFQIEKGIQWDGCALEWEILKDFRTLAAAQRRLYKLVRKSPAEVSEEEDGLPNHSAPVYRLVRVVTLTEVLT